MTSTPTTDGAEWAVALFNRSVLKQEKHRRITSRVRSAIYPGLWPVSKLDRLLVGQSGYKLIVRARLRPAPPASRYADRCRA